MGRLAQLFSAQLLMVLGAALAGCGSEAPAGGGGAGGQNPEEDCLPPSRLIGERCVPPGVQDDGCPAGTLGLADGTCLPAGVPPEDCMEGFVPEGDGCRPVLPKEPCAVGLMAVPGEISCRPIMDCGQGPWGELPIDGATQHVDQSYGQGDSDGTAQKPWTVIQDGVDAVVAGGLVAVAEGVYAERVSLSGNPVRLWGVCPDKVAVLGDGSQFTVEVLAGGSGLGGMEIRGADFGVLISGAEEVIVDRLWVHGTGNAGIFATDQYGPTAFLMRDSLIEEAAAGGIVGLGVAIAVEASVVRSSKPAANQFMGRGINIQNGNFLLARPSLVVSGSVILGNRDLGVYFSGADGTVEGTVVSDTLPEAATQMCGRGVAIQLDPLSGEGSDVVLRGLLVDKNHDAGVYVSGSRALMEGVVVRRTAQRAATQDGGIGVVAETIAPTETTELVLRRSLVEDNLDIGVSVASTAATIESTIVRGHKCRETDGYFGRGINAQHDIDAQFPSTLAVSASLVEQNAEIGISVFASNATIEATLVRDTAAPCAAELVGGGIVVQADDGPQPTLALRTSRIEASHGMGLWIGGYRATVEDCQIAETRAYDGGLWGDSLGAGFHDHHATVDVNRLLLRDGARAAIASYGSWVAVGSTAIECHPLDLNGELSNEADWTFEDRGGNRCGCSGKVWPCRQVSTNLQPPGPVSPLP